MTPEKLQRALLLQALYSIGSARMLTEQLTDYVLFRCFVALFLDVAVWEASRFLKNQEPLLGWDVAKSFLVSWWRGQALCCGMSSL